MSFRLESNSFVCRVNVHSLVRPTDVQVMTSLNVTLLAAACARLVFSEVDGRASH